MGSKQKIVSEVNGEQPPPAAPAAAAGAPGPSLSITSNNSDKGGASVDLNRLSAGHKRAAEILRLEVAKLASVYGLERLLFVTLTCPDEVSYQELGRRWNNLWRRAGAMWWERCIGVPERGTYGGRWHLHLLAVAHQRFGDVRGSADFDEFALGCYSSATQSLRDLWREMRERLPAYGFGRAESLPIRSTADAISKYVGGYIKKGIEKRLLEDKGKRLVRYCGYLAGPRGGRYSVRCGSVRFTWAGRTGWLWRAKLRRFVEGLGWGEQELEWRLGKAWRYHCRMAIGRQPVDLYPDVQTAKLDGWSDEDLEAHEDGVSVAMQAIADRYARENA